MPHRLFKEETLVIASHNKGKLREISDLLRPFQIKCISAGDLGLPEPEETETTFEGNARLKALAAATASAKCALSDDSGLCVNGLSGAPGIYSARWAGPEKDFYKAMARIWKELDEKDEKDHSAYFACALCLAWPDGHTETFVGKVHGTLVREPRGTQGFGYDPIFKPQGHEITFGEMDPDDKHKMSHRAKAFEQLIHACFQ